MASEEIREEKNGEWQDCVDHCIDIFKNIQKSEYRKAKIATQKEAYRIYDQIEKKTNYPWPGASSVDLPMFTITTDNLEPRLYAGLTGKKPIVQLNRPGITEEDTITEILEDWFNEELIQKVKLNNETSTIIHKAILEGTVYPIAGYTEDEIMRRDFVFDEMGNIAIDEESGDVLTQDIKDTIFQGGKIEYAEFQDVYIADDADDWEKADVIRKIRPTYAELQQKKDQLGYMNIGTWLLNEERIKKLSEEDQSAAQALVNVEKIGKEVIPCIECYINYIFKKEDQDEEDITDWTVEKYVVVIALDSKIIIRRVLLRDINFKNEKVIKRIRLYKEHGRAYGSSVYEKIKSIQHGASDIFNMVVNVATITMIPWFMYTDAAGAEGEVILSPGKGIKVDDTSGVLFPKFAQNPRSYIVFIEMFMSLWEKLGSIGDIQIGRMSESRKDATATETMAAIQEGNIKHNYQSIAFKDDFISLLKTIYDLYYQNMPYNTEHTYKSKPAKIPRAEMRRPYKFTLSGSTDMANKVLEMQKHETLYKSIVGNPVVNPVEPTENYIKAIFPEADMNKYIQPMINQLLAVIKDNPEVPQVIKQHLQNKQTAAATQERAKEMSQAQTMGKQAGQEIIGEIMGY